MYVPRTLETFLRKAATEFPVLLVTGARQVGKTTFLRHVAGAAYTYVTLDDPLALALAREDPVLFLQRFKPPVQIDEVQYAPGLLPAIKMGVDAEGKPGSFLLTGSQQFHLMKGVAESLAGRVGVMQLLGLSHREAQGRGKTSRPFLPLPERFEDAAEKDEAGDLKQLYRRIWRGSFPALVLSPERDRDLFFASYVQTYLQRDVRDLAKVGDEMAFLRFLRGAAARTGQLLNLADLARDAGVAPNTAKSWLSILEASGIVYLLEPYFTNVTTRLIKTPKLYFLDTGLCAWLTEWSSPETLEAGAMSGAILESWVVGEVLKSWWHQGKRAPVYFWRDKEKREIDLLLVRDGTLYPVEIKKSALPDRGACRHFGALASLGLPVGPGVVLCLVDRYMPLTKDVAAVPLQAI